jgi:hypothetical protein
VLDTTALNVIGGSLHAVSPTCYFGIRLKLVHHVAARSDANRNHKRPSDMKYFPDHEWLHLQNMQATSSITSCRCSFT